MTKNGKYPRNLFLLGCVMNLMRNCLLNVVMVVLLLVGIRVKPCLYAGLALLFVNLALAFILQLRLRRALKNMDDEGFKNIVLTPNWVKNVKNYTEEKAKDKNTIEGTFREIDTENDENENSN